MNVKHCQTCGKRLSYRQIQRGRRSCSNKCRINGHVNCAELNHDALKEPYSEAELAACDMQIVAGKRRVRLELDLVVFQRTPLDESPEAERRLRVALCGACQEDE